jgi:hypothetical protein
LAHVLRARKDIYRTLMRNDARKQRLLRQQRLSHQKAVPQRKEPHLTEYLLTLFLWMNKFILMHRLQTLDLQAWNRNLEQA